MVNGSSDQRIDLLATPDPILVIFCVAHEQRRSRILVSVKQIFSLFIVEVPQLPLMTTPSFPHPH